MYGIIGMPFFVYLNLTSFINIPHLSLYLGWFVSLPASERNFTRYQYKVSECSITYKTQPSSNTTTNLWMS